MTKKTLFVLMLGFISWQPCMAEVVTDATTDVSSGPATVTKEEISLPEKTPEKGLYPIHAGDKIKVVVQGEKDLSGTYLVDAKGDIHFPLLDKIHADGLSLMDFSENLRAALAKDFLTNPQVETAFEESAFNSVTFLGQVNQPGNYILPPKMTLLRMISVAGGFTAGANYAACKISRKERGGGKSSILVDVEAVLNGKATDAELEPGDIIFIPKTSSAVEEKDDLLNSVAVLGEVQKSDNYKLTPEMTIVRVLSQAGGMVKGADASRVTLTRKKENGKVSVVTVNVNRIIDGKAPDVKLEAGDIVYVPESVF